MRKNSKLMSKKYKNVWYILIHNIFKNMQVATPINTPNNTLYFTPLFGGWELRKIPMKASTEMKDWVAIGAEVSGSTTTGNATLMPTTNANGQNFIGILAERIASTDTDYATAGKLKLVFVPKEKTSAAKFKVGAGTFTAADINKVVAFHTDSASLAVDTAGAGAIISWYIDANYGICTFNVPNATTA